MHWVMLRYRSVTYIFSKNKGPAYLVFIIFVTNLCMKTYFSIAFEINVKDSLLHFYQVVNLGTKYSSYEGYTS